LSKSTLAFGGVRPFALLCVGLAALAVMFCAAPAMATVTGSQITSVTTPDGFTANPVGSQLFSGWNHDDPTHQNTVVSGTVTTDDSNAADTVDIRCYYGDGGDYYTLENGVVVNRDGTFTSAPDNFSDETCRLAAVDPSYSNPIDKQVFAGPVYGVGYQQDNYTISGGPNDGQRYDLFSDGHQSKGYFEWDSAGDCGSTWSQVFDGQFYDYDDYSAFDCALAQYTNGSGDGYGRSEIQIDGKNAYNTYGADNLASDGNGHNSSDNGNFPALTWTNSIDPATGDTTVTESEPLVDCGTASYPASAQCDAPDNTNQASFHSTGVRFDRSIKQSKDGLQATVTDTYTSTDGAAHTLDAEFDNYSQEEDETVYYVPGSSGFRAYSNGDSEELPAQAVGSILIQDVEYGDGNPGLEAPGAVTYTTQPDRLFWNAGSGGSYGEFVLGYKRTIPAGGSVSITHVLSQAADMVHVRALAAQAEDKAAGPSVAITSPANGASLSGGSVVVTGTASDNIGVTSLKVNGVPTSVNPDGTWSQRIDLPSGGQTITAVAADGAGNTAQAQETVNIGLLQCTVPNVGGKTTADAASALSAAGCALGAQSSSTSKTVPAGHVISQSIPAGLSGQLGLPVDLRISSGKFVGASLVSKTIHLNGRSLVVTVKCGNSPVQTGTVKLRTLSGKKRTLGTAAFSCPKNKKRTVHFTISGTSAKALKKRGVTRAIAFINARNTSGDVTNRSGHLTIRG
jgi:hypothetical protein